MAKWRVLVLTDPVIERTFEVEAPDESSAKLKAVQLADTSPAPGTEAATEWTRNSFFESLFDGDGDMFEEHPGFSVYSAELVEETTVSALGQTR